jgi:hypothetical protein
LSRASAGKRRSAAAGAGRIRVLDHELRALDPFLVIDFRSNQILVAHRIDQQRDAVFLHRGIIVVLDFVEGETVLEARTAAAADEYAQLEPLLPSSSINSFTLFAALSVKSNGAGISTAFMSYS